MRPRTQPQRSASRPRFNGLVVVEGIHDARAVTAAIDAKVRERWSCAMNRARKNIPLSFRVYDEVCVLCFSLTAAGPSTLQYSGRLLNVVVQQLAPQHCSTVLQPGSDGEIVPS